MPSENEYPLAAALLLRDQAVDDAKVALASCLDASSAAKRAVDTAVEAVEAHRKCEQQWREGEHRRSGARLAADFQHVQRYSQRLAAERERLQEEVVAKRTTLMEAEQAERVAREALAQARAEAKAVAEHHQRWQATKRREAERRAEAESEDLAQSRRS